MRLLADLVIGVDETQQIWIKGAEVQRVMEQPYRLTPALGSIRGDHSMCRKEGGAARGYGKSPDWELPPATVQLLLNRGSITLRDTPEAHAFLEKYDLVRKK